MSRWSASSTHATHGFEHRPGGVAGIVDDRRDHGDGQIGVGAEHPQSRGGLTRNRAAGQQGADQLGGLSFGGPAAVVRDFEFHPDDEHERAQHAHHVVGEGAVVAAADEKTGRAVADDRVDRARTPALVRQHEDVPGFVEGRVPDRADAFGAGRLAYHGGHGAVRLEQPAIHGELGVEHAQGTLGALAGGEAVEQVPGERRGAGIRAGVGADRGLDVGTDGLERDVGRGREQHDVPAAAGGDDVVGDLADQDPADHEHGDLLGG
ncbi:hypothetical protein BJQ94_02150 [Cryobacterium sp. SO2]|uniref:hypothetical protein n=1 Tax=Cryobacterium sp. SO2 TaxID=1897060 RepID=UPI00223E37D1|nr:hypothetical protein [Cryobacterium sp. SO2]WEO77871.1 hypothetical protein BJQ94_02150 [Cryobacterium sp. SO2]